MQSFKCNICNETVRKPKVDKHITECEGANFTCSDCSNTFPAAEYKTHACASEAEKRRKDGSPRKKIKKKGGEQSSSAVERPDAPIVKTEEQDEQPPLQDPKKKREKKKKHRDQEDPVNRLPDSAEPQGTKVENGTGDEAEERDAEPSKPKEKKRAAKPKSETQKDKKQQRKQDSVKVAKEQSKKSALEYNTTDSETESEPPITKKRRKEGDPDPKKSGKKRKRPSTKEGVGSSHYSTTSDEDASNSDSSTKKRKLSDNTISSDEEKSKEQDLQKSRGKATSPGSSDEGPKRKVVRRPKLVGDASNFPESIPVTVRWVMRHKDLKEISYHQLRELVIEEYTRKKQNHCSREEIKKALAKNFVIVHNPRSISLKLPRSSRKQGGGAEKSSDEE